MLLDAVDDAHRARQVVKLNVKRKSNYFYFFLLTCPFLRFIIPLKTKEMKLEALSVQVEPEVKKVLRREAKKNKRSMSKQAAHYIELGIKRAQEEKAAKHE